MENLPLPTEVIDKIIDFKNGDRETNKMISKKTIKEYNHYIRCWIRDELVRHIWEGDLSFDYLHEVEEFTGKCFTSSDLIDVVKKNKTIFNAY